MHVLFCPTYNTYVPVWSTGFDGSRIENELGFELKYKDIRVTVHDTVQSMISFGIVDGKRHLLPAAYGLMAAPILIVLLFAMLLKRLCCGAAGGKTKKN